MPSGDPGRAASTTPTLLVVDTASHVGKSTVAAGLCRLLADRGISVAPFKAQNMSTNARAVPSSTGEGWGEIGVSQYVQARAARRAPTTDCNPVLLKPSGGGESQLVIDGDPVGRFPAGEYYDEHWATARDAVVDAYERLAASHDVVVAEGAGAAIEPNLDHRDLANVETARVADADLLLVADVERGGMFASVVGTLTLLPEDLRERVVGVVVTKFRGDPALLEEGLTWLEERTNLPVLGVIPHDDPGLPEEDSVGLPDPGERLRLGGDDGVPAERSVTVAVPQLPRVSNATDIEPLTRVPGVRVEWVPLSASFEDADAVVLPGSKNTVDDLLACRDAGLDEALAGFDGPIVGLCGGYQLLGEQVLNADVEGTGDSKTVAGFGLLPVETVFTTEKRVAAVDREVETAADATHPLAGVNGTVSGYEIHMGDSRRVGDDNAGAVERPLGGESLAVGQVFGTYLHGLFENEAVREAFVDSVFATAGRERPAVDADAHDPYEAAAALVRDNLDLSPLPVPTAVKP
ncbi:MAG: cobyric acid synthase [Halolamina sp.]